LDRVESISAWSLRRTGGRVQMWRMATRIAVAVESEPARLFSGVV